METNQTVRLKHVGENLYVNGHGIYFAWFSKGGKQIKRSLKTADKVLARRRLGELRDKAGRLSGAEDRSIRFEELAAIWLDSVRVDVKASTVRRRKVCLNQITPYLKGVPVRSITLQMIEGWKSRRAGGVAARTFNKELETLNHVLRYARDVRGLILDNPAEKIRNRKTATASVQIPSKQQFRKLVLELRSEPQAVRSGAAAFAEFLAYSGLRLGEAREVRWRDINFELNTLLVTGGESGTKNHEMRTIPLFPALGHLIERMKAVAFSASPDERLFKLYDIRQALGSAVKRAGLPRLGHHALRHFFCSNAIEAGIDFKAIAGWLGHKDGGILVARTYGHLRNEHSAAMAQRMTFNAVETEEQ